MPNTITGKVYNETLKITQKRKSYAETQKEAKEQKKADNRKNSSDDQIEICYQDYTDDYALLELIQQPNTTYAVCLGNEQWMVIMPG